MTRLALIADAHFHDLYGNYDFPGVAAGDGRPASAYTLHDTVLSNRVYNESHFAFRAAVEDAAARGIRHILLLGDYSDDGQQETVASLARLLDYYETEKGLSFFATLGNHDIFGQKGRHRSAHFLNRDGSHTTVTSRRSSASDQDGEVIVTERMYCAGYEAALRPMAKAGFFRRPEYLHWETPFGSDDRSESRMFVIRSENGKHRYRMMDASYLVEPAEGLWLLSIDANVYVPRNDMPEDSEGEGIIDSTSAGWKAVVRHKPFILDWVANVTQRAERLGKRLVVFSHFPIMGPFDGTKTDEQILLGDTSYVHIAPDADVAEAAAAAGVRVHFSGHMHANDTALHHSAGGFLCNVSLPSIVAYPPAYKVITPAANEVKVETVILRDVPSFDGVFPHYREELVHTGDPWGALAATDNYYDYLSQHVSQLVPHRYLKRDWPEETANAFQVMTLKDLLSLVERDGADRPNGAKALKNAATISGTQLVEDWYRLRKGSELALADIPQERLDCYRHFVDVCSESDATDGFAASLAAFARMLGIYLSGLPSNNFTIDLKSGALRADGLGT